MHNSTKINKCSFCSYFVGGECTVAKSNGQINEYYCHQAIYEYNQWLRQQKAKNSKPHRHY